MSDPGFPNIIPCNQEHLETLCNTFIPWTGTPATLRPNTPLTAGMRISTDCPSRRILEMYEETFSKVNEGVSLTGHLYADLWIQNMLTPLATELGCEVVVEAPFKYQHGSTHFDAIIFEGELAAHFEIKTSSQKSPKPSAANRRQVIRQRAMIARDDIKGFVESYIIIIGKSGHTSGFVYGPFPIVPTVQEWEDTLDELDTVDLILDDIKRDGIEAREHPMLRDLCRCSDCFPPEPLPAGEELSLLLDGEYEQNLFQYRQLKDWYDDVRERVKVLCAGDGERVVESGRWRVSVGKSGRVTIKPRKDEEVVTNE